MRLTNAIRLGLAVTLAMAAGCASDSASRREVATTVSTPAAPTARLVVPPPASMSTAPHVSGASKPPAPLSSAAPGPGIYYQRHASNSYAITVVVLVLLVLVLAAVMYWVLTRDLGSAAPEKAALAEPGMNDFGTEYFQRNRI